MKPPKKKADSPVFIYKEPRCNLRGTLLPDEKL